MMKLKHIAILFGFLTLGSCSSIPDDASISMKELTIFPDYHNVVVPCNIAPMNFRIETNADAYITRIHAPKGEPLVCEGRMVQMDIDQWHELLAQNIGQQVTFEIYTKQNGRWYKHPGISNEIAADSIDGYLSYRLIEPSYEYFGKLSIRQRNLSNFDEWDIYNNRTDYTTQEFQCINCHSYQNYRTDNMQFHVRLHHGGTVVVNDGQIEKVNIKTDSLISNGVYPAWHPTEKLIAYSVNKTRQYFHSKDIQKIEVQDTKSDLVLYDVERHEVSIIENDTNALETFPAWSPDGQWLYYAVASLDAAQVHTDDDIMRNYDRLRYNLMRKPFDARTRTFGDAEMVFDADSIGRSATFPRISPDGRYLLFTLSEYGTFHIWHKNADLYLLDLAANHVRKLEQVNSDETESYHAWSSNGRWMVFSSRRYDGSYTRPYVAYFDRNGHAHKPFVVPQRDPEYYLNLFKSFNIPEFTVEPVRISPKSFARAIEGDEVRAKQNNE